MRRHVQVLYWEYDLIFQLFLEVDVVGLEPLETEDEHWRHSVKFDLLGSFYVVLALVTIPGVILL